MKKLTVKKMASVILLCASVLGSPVSAYASSDTSSAVSSQTSPTVSSQSDDDVPETTVSSNPQETLGTVGFAEANTKRIAVGKSTTLYLTVKDMGYNYGTTFTTSDKSIATVEQINNDAVKVVGIKNGTVTITATVSPRGDKGDKVAKYVLVVGDGDAMEGVESNTASETDENVGGIITDYDDTDLDLFSSTTDPMLIEYANARANTNATSLLLGLIAWIFIISAVVYVFSVVIGLRTPKMNVSPGTRRRYSTGGSSPRAGNRLLSDRYYRNVKKY